MPALRQGPTLRKLLGPSAWELWGRLQVRAFRSAEHLVTGTLDELGGPRTSARTTSWALRRLVAAGVVDKTKTRSGLAIRVLAFDRDQWGNGEYSPHLPPQALRWMHGRRPRGRPRKPKDVMPQPPEPQTIRRPPPAPPAPVPARPMLREDEKRLVQSYPFMPPDPIKHVASIPMIPKPPQLAPDERPRALREILIELYATAVRCYWPRASVAREVKWLRGRIGVQMLNAAAETFIQHRLPPAMWIRHEFDRVKGERKTPMRPEVLFDAARIEHWGDHAGDEQVSMLRTTPDKSDEFRIWRDGRQDLDRLYRRTHTEVLQLDDPTDEAAAREVADRIFPGGWEQYYRAADAKMRELQALLDQRAEQGIFLWGPRRG